MPSHTSLVDVSMRDSVRSVRQQSHLKYIDGASGSLLPRKQIAGWKVNSNVLVREQYSDKTV